MTRLHLMSEALHDITASAPGSSDLRSPTRLRGHQHPLHCRSTELSDTWLRTHEPAEQAVCPGSSLSPAQGTRSWKETPEATPAEGLTCCRSSQTVPVPRSMAPASSWRERAQQPALSSIGSSGPDSRCTKATRHTNRWANTTFCSDSWRRAEPGLSLRRARLCRRPWLTAREPPQFKGTKTHGPGSCAGSRRVQRRALPRHHASPPLAAGPSLQSSVCPARRITAQRLCRGRAAAAHHGRTEGHDVCLQSQLRTGPRTELPSAWVAFLV